jgi:hypothetical protein
MPEVYADVAETVWYTEDAAPPLTVFKPAAFAARQLLVAVHIADAAALSNLTAHASWTQAAGTINIANLHGKVWWHVYDGAEPSTWDFGYAAADGTALCLLRITGADVDSPTVVVPAPTTSTSNGASMDSPTVDPTGAHDLLVAVLAIMAMNNPFSSVHPTGMTDLGQVQLFDLWPGLAAAKEQLVAPGATGVRTWTSISPTGQSAGAWSIAIEDAGAFDPDPPRVPPLPTVSEALFTELLAAKSQRFVGHSGTAWIQEKLSGGASGASVTLVTAAGTKAGHVLYCFHGNNHYTAAEMTTPTGTAGTWTLETTADGGANGPHMKLWRRVVTVDGPQTVTVAPALDEEIWSHLFVIDGADTTNPTDIADNNSGAASTSHVAPSLTPTSPYPLMLSAVQGDGAQATYTPPPGMDEQTDFNTPGFGAGATARQVLPATNVATGTRTFISTVSQTFASISVAIRAAGEPAAGGGTGWTVDQTDDVGLTDGVIVDQSYVKTDSAGLTDTAVFDQSYVKTDSAGLTDSAAVELVKLVAATDSAGLTDTFALVQDKVATDSAGLTDGIIFTQSNVATDSAGLTDTSTIVLGKVIIATDDTGLTDNIALQRGLIPTDSAGLTDTTALTQSKTATDSAGLTDTATQQLVKDITQIDSAGLTDSQTYSRTAVLSDSAGLTDILGLAQTHIYTDSAGLTDDATPALIASFEPAFVSVDASTGSSGLEATTSTGTLDGTATLTGVPG